MVAQDGWSLEFLSRLVLLSDRRKNAKKTHRLSVHKMLNNERENLYDEIQRV